MCAFILLFRKFLLEYIYWVALRQLSFHDALSSVNLKKIFVHKPRVLLTSSQLTDPGLKGVNVRFWVSDSYRNGGTQSLLLFNHQKGLGGVGFQSYSTIWRSIPTASFHAFPLETVKPICSCSWLSLTTPVNTEGLKSASGPYVSVFY